MSNSPQDNKSSDEFNVFTAEIAEVQSTLLAATTDLISPLDDLVRAQIKRSQPPICAAVVLAVSKPQDAAQNSGDLRRKRILLAAALEMLHVALNVHRLLVNAARREQRSAQAAGVKQGVQQGGNEALLDRAFIGSTILAGDYCFSRAAQMAAQTDHPRVVATFSRALQSVSEGLLREQFNSGESNNHPQNNGGNGDNVDNDGSYDETRQLLLSGTNAAALLIDMPESELQKAVALSQELATNWQLQKQGAADPEWQPLTTHPEALPLPWQALRHWLSHQL